MSKTSLNLKTLLEGELAKGYDFRLLMEKFYNSEEARTVIEKVNDKEEQRFMELFLDYLKTEDTSVLNIINERFQSFLMKLENVFNNTIKYEINAEKALMTVIGKNGICKISLK